MKFIKRNIFLILIILIAAALRLIKLSSIPIGFNDDEAAFGYNAYSILKYGFDEWGRTLPFPTFESFGDWKLVFYLYLTVISQAIFGVNEFATRFPSAVFGVLAVWATYLLTKKLFEDSDSSLITHSPREALSEVEGAKRGHSSLKNVALLAAFFLAISPWHIVASRNAFESDLLSFFITLGTYFFLRSFQKKNYLFIATLLFTICFYVYRSSWLFVPIFVLVLFYLFRDKFQKSKELIFKNAVLVFILIIPLIPTVLTFKGQSRFFQESFVTGVSRIGITNEINERRGICQKNLPSASCNIAYNKYLFFFKSYANNYFKNLSYETFFENSSPTGFQSFMKRGAFYLFELPLIIAGLIFMVRTKSETSRILIPWLLLVPIGAAITGIGNYGRINLIMPAPQIIAAFGFVSIIQASRKFKLHSLAVLITCIIIVLSLGKLLIDMFYIEPFYTSRYQRYGYKDLFNYLASKEADYNQFLISKKIDNSHQYIQYLYFQKIEPQYLQANVKRSREKDGWVIFDSLGKFKFVQSVPGVESMPEKSLLVVGEKEVAYPSAPIHTISYLNGDPGFLIYDVDQVKLKLRENEK